MKKYLFYLSLLMVSILGTDLTDFALGIWVLDHSVNSGISSYTYIWFFEEIPGVILAPFIGSLVDRWDKRKMIIYGQLVSGIGSLFLMYLYSIDELMPWHIMLTAGIGSIASMFVFSAFLVATTALVDKDKLIKAQGMSTVIYAIISMGVPIMAPVLYKLIGLEYVFLFDAITFSVSILAYSFLAFVVVAKSNEVLSLKNDFMLVSNFIKQRSGLIMFFVSGFISSFLIGLVSVLFTPLILDMANEYILGMVLGFIGLGTIIGGLLVSLKNDIQIPIRYAMLTNIMIGVVMFLLCLSTNLYLLTLGGMLVIIFFTINKSMDSAFFMTIVPEDLLGRFSGVVRIFMGIAAPIAYLLAGPLVDKLTYYNTHFPEYFIDYSTGSAVSVSILTIFGLSGALFTIASLIFIGNRKIRALDLLYVAKLSNDKKISPPFQVD